jgi:uncharacterized protein YbcI
VSELADRRSLTVEVANALVALHKEQFGRGPTRASARFAGEDALLVVLENVLLPAERSLVDLGDALRVVDTRMALQSATAARFVAIVEEITGRKVRAFSSALDAPKAVAFEIFLFEPTEPPPA